jgi:hypothetical protein
LAGYVERQVRRQLADLGEKHDGSQKQRKARFLAFTALPSGMSSLAIHLLILIGLGIYALTPPRFGADAISIVIVEADLDAQEEETLEDLAIDFSSELEIAPAGPIEDSLWDDKEAEDPDNLVPDDLADLLRSIGEGPAVSESRAAGGVQGAGTGENRCVDEGLASRALRRRQALSCGATHDSENAVDRGLEWLVRHQRRDGSWSFNHREGEHGCQDCTCRHPGTRNACNGATGMALLALLGAGHTHRQGRYRQEVARGLCYLKRQQQQNGSLVDSGGTMYSHGLATLALCEACGMTRHDASDAGQTNDDGDRRPVVAVFGLPDAAQRGIRFIEWAQHHGGGWRYRPKQAGDTSVLGWQMMALKSGHLAGLRVNRQTVDRAVTFLDSVESRDGANYGYTSPGGTEATSAIGLLCRMYTGWGRDHKGLGGGVERLAEFARPGRGMYFYYYATQVMHHYRGPSWYRWNAWMRDYLVQMQVRDGREAGSWRIPGRHDTSAGRLYFTAMATMTLEVYYRYSPIYGDEAVAAEPVASDGTRTVVADVRPDF